MAAARNLRAVKAGEKAAPKRKAHTVASAVEDGDELDLAYALARRLAKAITAECSPRDLAALTKRLEDVQERVKVLEAAAVKEADADGTAEDEAFDSSAI